MQTKLGGLGLSLLLISSIGCGSTPGTDGGSGTADTGARDAGSRDGGRGDAATLRDAQPSDLDAGALDGGEDVDASELDGGDVDGGDLDGGGATIDAASDGGSATDSGVDGGRPNDAAVIPTDAAASTPSQQIAAVIAASTGTGLSLSVQNVRVTYLKPQIGSTTNDPAGFTVQAAQTGPAIFVTVDPATQTPALQVGDVVSFTVTARANIGMMPTASAITGLTRASTGNGVADLVQDLSSATDLVTGVVGYHSEVIDLSGTITGAFASSGTGFQAAAIATAGLPSSANLLLRMPSTLVTSLGARTGCTFALNDVPFGRFNANTQIPAYRAADITLTCPDAGVTDAGSGDAGFDGGVSDAAVVSDAAIASDAHVSDASVLTDANPGMSDGGAAGPLLVINELNANIASACDLIELRVLRGGNLSGMRLLERTSDTLVTFPSMTVATNDLIVVHVNGGSSTCNPSSATNETTAVNQFATAQHSRNYDTAYDLYSTDTGLTSTDNVFTLYAADGSIMDAVFVSDDAAGSAAAATETQADVVATANQWRTVAGTIPTGGFVDDSFNANAVLDLDATGTAASGTSIQRLDNLDDNNLSDWNQGTDLVRASTWGALNAGQTAL